MKLKSGHKVLLWIAVILIFSALSLYVARQFYDLIHDFSKDAAWLLPAALAILAIAALLAWRLVRRKGGGLEEDVEPQNLAHTIERAEKLGLDMDGVRQALEQQAGRREARKVLLALFGHVNSGKSTLIRSLVEQADPASAPTVGTTQEITRYTWKAMGEYQVEISDVPGRAEPDGSENSRLAWDEAMAADLVIYLCDGDLTREQLDDIEQLSLSKKPMVLALNKTDIYSDSEVEELLGGLREKANAFLPAEQVVAISAGGKQSVLVKKAGGECVEEWRETPQNIAPLTETILTLLESDVRAMISMADTVFLKHMQGRIRQMVERRRREEAERIIDSHSRGAVVAAMAAVVPGIEVVLLTGVGLRMVSQLNDLYGSAISMDRLELLLKASARQVSNVGKLSMIIGGNLLKAFPGAGTIAGGLMHAVVYGLVIQGVGKALLESLEKREEISEKAFLKRLDEIIKEPEMEKNVGDLLNIVKLLAKGEQSESSEISKHD